MFWQLSLKAETYPCSGNTDIAVGMLVGVQS